MPENKKSGPAVCSARPGYYPTAPSFASSWATLRSRRVIRSSNVRSSSGSSTSSAVRNFVIIYPTREPNFTFAQEPQVPSSSTRAPIGTRSTSVALAFVLVRLFILRPSKIHTKAAALPAWQRCGAARQGAEGGTDSFSTHQMVEYSL